MQKVCVGDVFAESRLTSVYILAEFLLCSRSTQLFDAFFLMSTRLGVGLCQGWLVMSSGHAESVYW